MSTEKDYPVKIPRWVYDRITEITGCVVGDTQWAVTRRQTLRQFLVYIWLEADDDGWTICTVRDIRSCYASLLSECEINYQGRASISMLVDFLPTLSDIEFRAGKASKDPEKRKASAWLFNPQQPVSDLGKLNLVDLETGESVSFRALLQGNGKAPGHAIDVEKRQTALKQTEKAFLAKVGRGRMSIQFVKELRSREPDHYYRAGICSLNHLYNGKIEGEYVTYDHHYRLTFGGRYYDQAGFAPIFPDTCYHLTHYWLAAVDIPVASDNPVHYADAIRYNARMPLQGSLLPLTRLVWA